MGTYETELGYVVCETINGLDVYEDGQIVCELSHKTLDNYRIDDEIGEIDDDALETAIKKQIEVQDFIDDQQGNW